MRRQKSVYQGWKGTSGLFGYSPIIKHPTDDPGGACDGLRSGSYASSSVVSSGSGSGSTVPVCSRYSIAPWTSWKINCHDQSPPLFSEMDA